MAIGEGRWNELPRDVRETLREYLSEVTAALGTNLQAVILYGSAARGEYIAGRSNINLLLVLQAQDADALTACAKTHHRWRKEGIVVPLILSHDNLKAWLNVFPLEGLELAQHHLVLHGSDPLQSLQFELNALPLQCIQEIRGNALRLRQRFVEGDGTPEAIQVLLPLAITSLLPCLRGVIKLLRRPVPATADEVLVETGAALGADVAPLRDAWRLKTGAISPGKLELPRLFDRYVEALEVLGERAVKAVLPNSPPDSGLVSRAADTNVSTESST